jgi:hypothetical protein
VADDDEQDEDIIEDDVAGGLDEDVAFEEVSARLVGVIYPYANMSLS